MFFEQRGGVSSLNILPGPKGDREQTIKHSWLAGIVTNAMHTAQKCANSLRCTENGLYVRSTWGIIGYFQTQLSRTIFRLGKVHQFRADPSFERSGMIKRNGFRSHPEQGFAEMEGSARAIFILTRRSTYREIGGEVP